MPQSIQTVIFSKARSPGGVNEGKGWTVGAAKKWLRAHDMKAPSPDETENSYRFRQFSPSLCKGNYKTLTKNMPAGLVMVSCNRPRHQGYKMELTRQLTIDRAAVNPETGEFTHILASEGEASDGHILSIRGAELPDKLPLQNSHINDPRATLGSISKLQKDMKLNPPVLRGLGQIELDGHGAQAEIRRDVLLMINKGHVSKMSVRWDSMKATPRMNLPKDHPYHVADDEKDYRKRYGIFFERWVPREGSIVVVPADQKAIIGRASETSGEVSSFWRTLAEKLEREEKEVSVDSFLKQMQDCADECRKNGLSEIDLINMIISKERYGDLELEPYEYRANNKKYVIMLPKEMIEDMQDRDADDSVEAACALEMGVSRVDREPVKSSPPPVEVEEAEDGDSTSSAVRDIPVTVEEGGTIPISRQSEILREELAALRSQINEDNKDMLRKILGRVD